MNRTIYALTGWPKTTFFLTRALTSVYLYHIHLGMGVYDDLKECIGFEWDDGNESKNWEKHRVYDVEAEEVFLNDPLVAGADKRHSKKERRYFVLGATNSGRFLFIAFTIRKNLIRIISARNMTRREFRKYHS